MAMALTVVPKRPRFQTAALGRGASFLGPSSPPGVCALQPSEGNRGRHTARMGPLIVVHDRPKSYHGFLTGPLSCCVTALPGWSVSREQPSATNAISLVWRVVEECSCVTS